MSDLVSASIKVIHKPFSSMPVQLITNDNIVDRSQSENPISLITSEEEDFTIFGVLKLEDRFVVLEENHASLRRNLHIGSISVRGKCLDYFVCGQVIDHNACTSLGSK